MSRGAGPSASARQPARTRLRPPALEPPALDRSALMRPAVYPERGPQSRPRSLPLAREAIPAARLLRHHAAPGAPKRMPAQPTPSSGSPCPTGRRAAARPSGSAPREVRPALGASLARTSGRVRWSWLALLVGLSLWLGVLFWVRAADPFGDRGMSNVVTGLWG